MKFLSILAVAGLAAADISIYERQVATLIDVVTQISTDTQALDTAVKGFNGAGDIQKLQAASDKVASSVANGVKAVTAASSISLTDALQIQGQVQSLQSSIETTVNDLIAKKSTLVSAGAGPQVSESLNQQLLGSQQLSAAISGKVPPEVAKLAGQLSSGITDALQKGVDAFQGVGGATETTSPVPSPSETRATSPSESRKASPSASRVASATASQGGSATGSGKPATFTGAAAPQAVIGGLAGVAGLFAVVF